VHEALHVRAAVLDSRDVFVPDEGKHRIHGDLLREKRDVVEQNGNGRALRDRKEIIAYLFLRVREIIGRAYEHRLCARGMRVARQAQGIRRTGGTGADHESFPRRRAFRRRVRQGHLFVQAHAHEFARTAVDGIPLCPRAVQAGDLIGISRKIGLAARKRGQKHGVRPADQLVHCNI